MTCSQIIEKIVETLDQFWSVFSSPPALIFDSVILNNATLPPNNVARSNKEVDNMTPINIIRRVELNNYHDRPNTFFFMVVAC